jgi:hypothetical protein
MPKHKGKFTLTGISCSKYGPQLQKDTYSTAGRSTIRWLVCVADNHSLSFLERNVRNLLLWLLSLCVAGLLLRVQLRMRPWHTVLLRCFCLKAVCILWLCALFGQYGLFLYVIIREGIIQQFSWVGTRAAVKVPSVNYTRIEHSHCDALQRTLCLALITWRLYF